MAEDLEPRNGQETTPLAAHTRALIRTRGTAAVVRAFPHYVGGVLVPPQPMRVHVHDRAAPARVAATGSRELAKISRPNQPT